MKRLVDVLVSANINRKPCLNTDFLRERVLSLTEAQEDLLVWGVLVIRNMLSFWAR